MPAAGEPVPGETRRRRRGLVGRGERDGDAPDPRPTIQQVAEDYGDRIYTFAFRLTGNPDDAADLAQDVFIRVTRNLHTYDPGTFDGWLYRITKNLFLDGVRRRARVRVETLSEDEWKAPASSEPGPADVLERDVLEADIAAGLASLRYEFRLAVVLCDMQGLSYEEIADVTGWPLGTVRSRIHRGRSGLRDALAARTAHGYGPSVHPRGLGEQGVRDAEPLGPGEDGS